MIPINSNEPKIAGTIIAAKDTDWFDIVDWVVALNFKISDYVKFIQNKKLINLTWDNWYSL